MTEKWKKWQTRKNKCSIIWLCLAIFLIITMILITYGVIEQEDLANMWSWG